MLSSIRVAYQDLRIYIPPPNDKVTVVVRVLAMATSTVIILAKRDYGTSNSNLNSRSKSTLPCRGLAGNTGICYIGIT